MFVLGCRCIFVVLFVDLICCLFVNEGGLCMSMSICHVCCDSCFVCALLFLCMLLYVYYVYVSVLCLFACSCTLLYDG